MKELHPVSETRKARLSMLLEEAGRAAELSRRTGVPQPMISQVMSGAKHAGGQSRKVGDATARKLEVGMGKPVGWMDQPIGPQSSEFELSSALPLKVAAAFAELSPTRQRLILQLLAEFGHEV